MKQPKHQFQKWMRDGTISSQEWADWRTLSTKNIGTFIVEQGSAVSRADAVRFKEDTPFTVKVEYVEPPVVHDVTDITPVEGVYHKARTAVQFDEAFEVIVKETVKYGYLSDSVHAHDGSARFVEPLKVSKREVLVHVDDARLSTESIHASAAIHWVGVFEVTAEELIAYGSARDAAHHTGGIDFANALNVTARETIVRRSPDKESVHHISNIVIQPLQVTV